MDTNPGKRGIPIRPRRSFAGDNADRRKARGRVALLYPGSGEVVLYALEGEGQPVPTAQE